MFRVLWAVIFLALFLALWLVWRMLRPSIVARRVEQARHEFADQRSQLEARFFQQASATGKPRGLAWKSCAFQNQLVLARDLGNGDLVGLIGVAISFAAIAGGGMEEVEAVGNLRAATAVFTHDGRQWNTAGRVIFNLEPHEVVERYQDTLTPLAA